MNPQTRVWKIAAAVGVLLVIFLAVLSIKELKSIEYVGKDVPAVNTISVNGYGEAYAVPDVATFSFSVTETAKTVSDAQNKATTKVNSALKTVRDAGVADKDIKTTSYSINPHYEYQNAVCPTPGVYNSGSGSASPVYCPPGRSVLTGYDVGESIEVKVRDLNKAGAIFASIGALNVENVNGLSFSVDNPDSVKAEARATAISKAEAKADMLARQLGVRLVRVTSFYDSSDQSGPVPYGLGGGEVMTLKSVAATPEVPAGQQKVTSNVTITYEIE